jgi:hypothetical protein
MAPLKKIESLTPEQETALVAYREECLAVGRSCEAADREAAETVFRSMYAALGMPAPYVWWCDGPAVGSMVRMILKNQNSAILKAPANLRDNLWANLWDNLGANLWANLGANLGDNLRDNLGDNLRANLGDNLRANLGDNLRDNLSWYFWGQYELAWQAYYAFPDAVLRTMHTVEQRERLGWWLTLSRSCGWWEPFQGIVFVCERPFRQAVDDDGRLHHESQAALLCRDGWPVYAWHGVRVTQQVIEAPETLTAQQILAEPNAEVRRVMMERFGFERLLAESSAEELDRSDFGTLYRLLIPDDEPLVMVRVTNSTPEPDGHFKDYTLRVNPECRPMLPDNTMGEPQELTALAAVASTFGMTGREYVLACQS